MCSTRPTKGLRRSPDAGLFTLRNFRRFLIAEDLSKEKPAAAVTLPSPNRPG